MDDKFFNRNNVIFSVMIIILILAFFYLEYYFIGIVSTIIFLILIIYSIISVKNDKEHMKEIVDIFSEKIDLATRNTLINMPLPLIIMDFDDTILWYNEPFKNTFEEDIVIGTKISQYKIEFKKINFNLDHKIEQEEVAISNRYYNIIGKRVVTSESRKNKDLILLYFIDITENKKLIMKIEEEKNIVFLIEVDNHEDVIKSTEEDKIPLLVAEIERTIKNYAMSLKSVHIKYSDNKFIILTQQKYLLKEIEDKFSILEDVKNLDYGNNLKATLSIGIGIGGESPLQNHQYAIEAMELSLSRGGDQVVLKEKENLNFFGGKSKEVEKTSRVKVRVISHALKSIILQSSNIILMGHNTPDIDCIGAAIGLRKAIDSLNKECYIYLNEENGSLKNSLRFIFEEENYKNTFINEENCLKYINKGSLLILLDVNSESYCENPELISHFEKKIIIDHHRKSKDSIKNVTLSYIEPFVSSTSEMITEIIQYIDEKASLAITTREANFLLAGIVVDTKNFNFKTGARTFAAAAFLKKHGADSAIVKKMLSSSLEFYKKKAKLINLVEIQDNIAFVVCTDEINDSVLGAQVADDLLNISGVEASFVLMKDGENVLISGRSYGKISVQLILENLGGGGHFTMAGAKLQGYSPIEAKEELLKEIDKYFEGGNL
ncbi:GGDEF domain-containing protein [Clostridium sp. DL1XJH146]